MVSPVCIPTRERGNERSFIVTPEGGIRGGGVKVFSVVQKKQNSQKAKSPGASTEANCRPRIPSPLTISMDMSGFTVKLNLLVWARVYAVAGYLIVSNKLIFNLFLKPSSRGFIAAADSVCLVGLDNRCDKAIIGHNTTPPASRQISAPRGVTRFWGVKE